MLFKISFLKRNTKKLIAITLLFVYALSAFYPNIGNLNVYAAWDGYVDENVITSLNTELFDFNSAIQIIQTGGSPDSEHTKNGNRYSIGWTDTSAVSTLYLKAPVNDWSDYERMEFWIYSEEATQDTIIVLAESQPGSDNSLNYYKGSFIVDWTGWKKVSVSFTNMEGARNPDWKEIIQVRFCSSGWSINPNGCTSKLYIADARITDGGGTSFIGMYDDDQIQKAKDAMIGGAAVYAGSPNVVVDDGKVQTLDEDINVYTYKVCDTVMVPISFFKKFFDAKIKETETEYSISTDSHKISGKVNEIEFLADDKKCNYEQPAQILDGKVYVDVTVAAKSLGFTTVSDKSFAAVSGNEDILALERYSGVNELNEIISYYAAYINVDNKNITDDDYKAVKDKWLYELVGSIEDNDVENPEILTKLNSINNDGKSAQNEMIKQSGQTELFKSIKTTATTHMTSTYGLLCDMALAYGTYGCELYHNESLKNDILYGLKWMYENRYGQNEIDGKGWRSTSAYNWWDWKIGSPKRLISVLMIMEDQLTQNEIDNYLSLFNKLVPTASGVGSNAMNTARLLVGAGLLQKDSKKITRAQTSMEKTMLYVDNGRNSLDLLYGDRGPKKKKGEGFYTDGSYIFHTLHPMNGTYGTEHFTLVGPFVSLFVGTKFEMTSPLIDNLSDWIYNAFDPLIYQGAIFRIVKGRNPTGMHQTAALILGAMIDSIDFLSDEDSAKVKSIIKAQIRDDTSLNYYNALELSQVIKLAKIMNDESVRARDSLLTNHVYYNEDKVVHQRGNFALGISMSSSRIFDYESINNQNLNGWYVSDGMTEYYTKDNFTQSQNGYWKYVNPYRLPGTTVDTQQRKEVSIYQGNEYLSSKDFVGGVSLDETYGVAAMWLESYHYDSDFGAELSDTTYGGKAPAHDCNLQAKKAWFMFDDEVVCLGSDINASNGFDVLTVVDNKKATKSRNLTENVNEPYDIANVFASETPEPENVASNTIDGNFNTKWAGKSDATVTWDIGKIGTLGFIQLSFQNGSKRKQNFNLEISEDGNNWNEVFSGSSSGTTESGEIFSLESKNGRYVRFTNKGNSAGTPWVSLTTATIYPPNADGSLTLPEAKYVGEDKVVADGKELTLSGEDTNLTGTKWAHMENVGGYYFPLGGTLYAKYTENANSFMEMWFDHGKDPCGDTFYIIYRR